MADENAQAPIDHEESEDSSSEDDQEPYHDINSCLPFKLQEFCLIAIINELDSYPVESLAMLPRHLRYRLLSNLPNFDLSRLENTTPVTEGIDTDKIWKSTTRRFSNKRLDYDFMHASLFMTRESKVDLAHLRNVDDIPHLQPEVVAAAKKKPCREQYFLTLVWNIVLDIGMLPDHYIRQHGLEYYPDEHAEALDGLTVVPSHDFLIQMPGTVKGKDIRDENDGDKDEDDGGSSDDSDDKYESTVLDSYRRLWKKQATPLTRFKKMCRSYDTHVLLAPKRLLFIRQSKSHLELLNYIVIGCGLQPLNLCINASDLYQADLNLSVQHSTDENIRLYLKHLLSKIVVLSLEGVASEQAGILRYVFEMVVQNCTLKALEISSGSKSQLDLGFLTGESMPRLGLRFLSPYLFTLPSNPPSLPHYQGLSVLEIGSPLEPTSLPHLTALIEQQHSLTHINICLLDSCQDQSDNPTLVSMDERRLYDALSLLFNREDFQFLKVNFACNQTQRNTVFRQGCCNLFPFTQILQSFMVSQCTFNQKLHFKNIRSLPPKQVLPLTLAASGDTTPECGTQHKLLVFEFADIDIIVPHLIQLPVIRLWEFAFKFGIQSQSLFNQIAHHPNMNVTKLLINFDFEGINPEEVNKRLSTLCRDFEKLFQMPTLKELCLCGQWLCFREVKKALVIGLQQQSQFSSLDKIHLRQESLRMHTRNGLSTNDYNYDESEFKELWSAIFSLPHLDRVEVKLLMDQSITMYFVDRIHIIHDCWKQFSFNKKLKSLLLSFHDWEDYFEHVWGEDRLKPLNALTRDVKVFVDSHRTPKMYSYTHFTVCDAF